MARILVGWHMALKERSSVTPNAIFMGGNLDKTYLVLFNRPLREDDFIQLWSLGRHVIKRNGYLKIQSCIHSPCNLSCNSIMSLWSRIIIQLKPTMRNTKSLITFVWEPHDCYQCCHPGLHLISI